ncbi:H-NS histone family protein [Limnohabitans sp.]|uniref:H-NS histone family protein n=1 Tax=Limnohabitans sp. TaxID=1907725 RepID=UPI0025C47AA2|nr:H-NS histone family protein [Limnohabitans sp.]
MSTLAELIKQREALEAQIAQVRQTKLADAIGKVRALVAEYGLTAEDIFGGSKRGPKAAGASKNPFAPKYRDAATGHTWTGRGKAPKWIDGKDRAQFVI